MDEEVTYEEVPVDQITNRLMLLIPMAKLVDETQDKDAKSLLKAGMSLIVRSVSPPVLRGEIVPINGGKSEPEA